MEKDDKMEKDPELGDEGLWNIDLSKNMSTHGSRRTSQSRSRRVSRDLLSNSLGPSGGVSYGLFGGTGGNPLDLSLRQSNRDEDEDALRWAALEKLPTYRRIRTSILQKHTGSIREVDVKYLSMADFHHLLQTLHRPTDNEEEQLLSKMRKRLDRSVKSTTKQYLAESHSKTRIQNFWGGVSNPTKLTAGFSLPLQSWSGAPHDRGSLREFDNQGAVPRRKQRPAHSLEHFSQRYGGVHPHSILCLICNKATNYIILYLMIFIFYTVVRTPV